MPSTLNIETADVYDISVLQRLAHQVWHAHYPTMITVEQIDHMLEHGYSTEKIATEMTKEGITWLKIMKDSKVIGFASFGPYDKKRLKLHKLYLSMDHHGQGIGAAVLAEIERRAASTVATSIVLNVNKHNSKAIKSYKNSGYLVIESVINDIGNGFVMDDYLMEKVLIQT